MYYGNIGTQSLETENFHGTISIGYRKYFVKVIQFLLGLYGHIYSIYIAMYIYT